MRKLIADQISVRYGDQSIFDAISVELNAGEVMGITGPSGGGKSTLLKALAGLVKPVAGEIRLDSDSAHGIYDRLISGHEDIAYVPQDFQLMERHTALQNVYHAVRDEDSEEAEKKAIEILGFVGMLEKANESVHLFSGGQRQRLAFARAIASGSRFLLLDEPSNQLDARWRNEWYDLIRKTAGLKNRGVLLVSHSPRELMQVCDKVAILSNGVLGSFRSPFEMYKQPKTDSEALYFSDWQAIYPDFPVEGAQDQLVWVKRSDAIFEQNEVGKWQVIHKYLLQDGWFITVQSGNATLQLKSSAHSKVDIGNFGTVHLRRWKKLLSI